MEPLAKWNLKERTQNSRAETFRQFILFAGALGFTLALTLSGILRLSPSELAALLQDGLQGRLSAVTYVRFVVYIVLFLFGLSWGLNGLHELNLLQDWLKPEHFTLRRRNLMHAASILIGILLGVLFALTPSFRTFIVIFCFYTLADIFLWKLRKDEIALLLQDNARTLERDIGGIASDAPNADKMMRRLVIFRQGADILKEYYLIRGHLSRVGVQLFGVGVLAVSPWLWQLIYHDQRPRDFTMDGINILGYALFVWCLSISEVVVYIWRRDMDTRLAALGRDLHDLNAV